ncbi:MAG: N-acetyltransferase [Rhodospirillaceae bacterium]|jgi:predicted N-acetyltransferase YhbS|nr:N-acetyltransferase [Rhodospirillaceae bacterium]MBT4044230.1 N-acetyltransferase [Rhodospirillaceae bacterium]MBT4688798.1 N-acetyltransferase [Rhodospirillaceae bacterium]MBT5083376.1 N-acetyltransferase [Rhodospirillaceae bacterium]MBT5525574.1 N-acetyltransferase [Rhodospirillaceae bacterium]
MFQVTQERPGDKPNIEKLLDKSFGTDRLQTRVAYALRSDVSPLPELCFVMRGPSFLCASIRYWPVLIDGQQPCLLLGPLAVGQAWRGGGLGKILLGHSLARAKILGHGAVLVIGDPDYYEPFGFAAALADNLTLPRPVDPGRFQGCELIPGSLAGLSGPVTPVA